MTERVGRAAAVLAADAVVHLAPRPAGAYVGRICGSIALDAGVAPTTRRR